MTQIVDNADKPSEIPQTSRYTEVKEKISKSIKFIMNSKSTNENFKKTELNLILQTLVDVKKIFTNIISKDTEYEKLVIENAQLKEEVLNLTNQINFDETFDNQFEDNLIETFDHAPLTNSIEKSNHSKDEYFDKSKLKASNCFQVDDSFATINNKPEENKHEIIHDESDNNNKCFESIELKYSIDGGFSKNNEVPSAMIYTNDSYSNLSKNNKDASFNTSNYSKI
jgi:hypothetical protein